MQVNQSSTWLAIKEHLQGSLEKQVAGLQQLGNTREKDIEYKARIAVIRELLQLPQTLENAAKNKRI